MTNEYTDEYGYPNTTKLPNLYAFLWNNNQDLFDPEKNYWWAKPAEDVMYICSEYYRYIRWMEKEEEEYQEDLKEYNEALKLWESEEEMKKREEEDYTNNMFKMAFNQKQDKISKKKKFELPKKPVMNKIFQRLLKTGQKTKAKVKKVKDKEIDIDDLPEAKDFTEVDETRAPASLIFIGHVDAGKSTICGQLMLTTGMVDERTIQQYKKEAIDKGRDSWWLAYVMDINEEEKAKGKTVEVGRTALTTPRI